MASTQQPGASRRERRNTFEGARRGRHLGLDLGGTNIKWVVVEGDGDDARTVDRGQVATPTVGGPGAVVPRLAAVANQAAGRWPGIASVGIGVPGLYDPAAGTTRFLVNVPGAWAGTPVAGPVGDALGVPAALINDARAFGLAEHRLGAGRGVSSLVGLTLGTGIGGVIVLDGRVLFGHDGTAGELGHQTLDPDGPPCGCGNRGCLEAFARADRIATTCGTATAEEAVERARAGDERATAGLARIGRYLGIGIANVVTLLSPDLVVVGGGVAAAGDLILEPIRAELSERVRTTSLDEVVVVTAELGVWAGAIGAALHGATAAALRGATAAAGAAARPDAVAAR
ncbi:MAG TPA: ROK family protein [Candidatus Limnocylindrales bacterium]|nr:ROK family protein [Candidatus Limnocylindrales bacterium]